MKLASIALVGISLFVPAAVRADVPTAPAATAPAAAKIRVQVLGRVKTPGNLELDAGARLSDALTASGAFAIEKLVARLGGEPVSDTECVPGGTRLPYVYLVRTGDDSRTVSFAVDITRMQRRDDLRNDPVLKANDKVFVPDCRERFAPRFPIPAD